MLIVKGELKAKENTPEQISQLLNEGKAVTEKFLTGLKESKFCDITLEQLQLKEKDNKNKV